MATNNFGNNCGIPKSTFTAKGDKVVFAKYAGTELTIDGKPYLVMNIDDILGVF